MVFLVCFGLTTPVPPRPNSGSPEIATLRRAAQALHSSKQELVQRRVQAKDVEATFARLSAPKTARGCALGRGWVGVVLG